MKKLIKGAAATDIHFGRKQNSKQHNEDCLNFVKWFCECVIKAGDIDHIVFLGDWFESRSAIDVETLTYSYRAAKLINNIGLPVYFILGNHDLYYKNTRDVYSVVTFNEFNNFNVITDPTYEKNVGDGTLFCPYLFHEEYDKIMKHLKVPVWWGHLEFKGFVITGYTIKMLSGPDHCRFEGPKHIITGHFHKRQIQDNIVYMGSTFPMDFSDAGDDKRGMVIYDYITNKINFIDWPDCPMYQKITLSSVVDGSIKIIPRARIKCIIDTSEVSYDDQTELRRALIKTSDLREFTFVEMDIDDASNEAVVVADDMNMLSVDEQVVAMLKQQENNRLVDIYKSL